MELRKKINRTKGLAPDRTPYAVEFYMKIHENVKNIKNSLNYEFSDDNIFKVNGDADFNLNKSKVNKLMEFATDYDVGDKLNELHEYTHTLVNFSIVPVSGGLNKTKSRLDKQGLDRLDTLIYYLDLYYQQDKMCNVNIENTCPKFRGDCLNGDGKCINIERKKIGKKIIKCVLRMQKNRDVLDDFLQQFHDVYDYCRKIYFIYDTSLVDELIKSGKITINSNESLNDYLMNVESYWNYREKIFKNKIL